MIAHAGSATWDLNPTSAEMVRNVKVSEGPTPFISFVNTSVNDVAGFRFAQFLIFPKTNSATRPIKVRYARSYLEARGYFNSQNGNLTIPVFGLYAGRANRVKINLGFSGRFDLVRGFGVKITTPAYDGGTDFQSDRHSAAVTRHYPELRLYPTEEPLQILTTPIIIDTDAEIRWVVIRRSRVQPLHSVR